LREQIKSSFCFTIAPQPKAQRRRRGKDAGNAPPRRPRATLSGS
jgi:hypothetical protein